MAKERYQEIENAMHKSKNLVYLSSLIRAEHSSGFDPMFSTK